MIDLAISNPKRLFTFGCSFTDYRWATWANILAYELDCEFHNFGKSGAGNQFQLAHMCTQTKARYLFQSHLSIALLGQSHWISAYQ